MDANAQVIHGATENQKKTINEPLLFFSGAFRGKRVALLETRTHPADVTVVNRARSLTQEVAQQLPWWPLFCVSVSHYSPPLTSCVRDRRKESRLMTPLCRRARQKTNRRSAGWGV